MGGWRVSRSGRVEGHLRAFTCSYAQAARVLGRGGREEHGKGDPRQGEREGAGVEERRSSNRLSRERSGKRVTGRWNREEKAAKEDGSFNKTL